MSSQSFIVERIDIYLLSQYNNVKRSCHVHQEDLRILTLTKKRRYTIGFYDGLTAYITQIVRIEYNK